MHKYGLLATAYKYIYCDLFAIAICCILWLKSVISAFISKKKEKKKNAGKEPTTHAFLVT